MSATLNAAARSDGFGKGGARKLRATGRVPAVIYANGDAATHITLDPVELGTIFRKSHNRNTVVDVTVDGNVTPCLVRDAQRHPLSRDILHVDFYAVDKDRPVTVMVPVNPTGKAAGAIVGGRIRVIRRELPVRCSYTAIPERLDIDISPMVIGDMIKASEINTPDGVDIHLDSDINVVTCYGRQAEKALIPEVVAEADADADADAADEAAEE